MKQARSRAEWRELVRGLAKSGMSTREFAAKHDLNARTLVWWRSLFRREEANAGKSLEAPVRLVRPPRARAAMQPVRFARVALATAPAAVTVRPGVTPTVRLDVGRVRIWVRSGVDRATLATVLHVLGVGEAR